VNESGLGLGSASQQSANKILKDYMSDAQCSPSFEVKIDKVLACARSKGLESAQAGHRHAIFAAISALAM
jgi:hypothetical protein